MFFFRAKKAYVKVVLFLPFLINYVFLLLEGLLKARLVFIYPDFILDLRLIWLHLAKILVLQ